MQATAAGTDRHPDSDATTLGDAFESALLGFIRERAGLAIQAHQLPNLRAAVRHAIERFGHADAPDYLRRLQAGAEHTEELDFLIERITVDESYFFRDAAQMSFIETVWLPELVRTRREATRRVRIWSAGCAQGQEIYTLAIMLREALPERDSWDVQLLGTDISAQALAAARRACFHDWSFRVMPVALRERYFTRRGARSELDESVRSMVSFHHLNLSGDAHPGATGGVHDFDLILCRNVFIYFDRAAARAATRRLGSCLSPSGVLLLGASDPIDTSIDGLELEQHQHVFCHRRARPPGRASVAHRPLEQLTTVPAVTPTTPRRGPTAAVSTLPIGGEEYNESPDAEPGPAALLELARASADNGDFDAAHRALDRGLALDPMNKHSHFLAALVYMERGDARAAEKSLRRTLFLDPDHLEAHHQLAILLLREGDAADGLRCLENARRVARECSGDTPMGELGDVTADETARRLDKELGALRARYCDGLGSS